MAFACPRKGTLNDHPAAFWTSIDLFLIIPLSETRLWIFSHPSLPLVVKQLKAISWSLVWLASLSWEQEATILNYSHSLIPHNPKHIIRHALMFPKMAEESDYTRHLLLFIQTGSRVAHKCFKLDSCTTFILAWQHPQSRSHMQTG